LITAKASMVKRPVPPTATDAEVRILLEHYLCPVPFHEVRTRFLGNIASPVTAASPMKEVASLWGGELPDFDTIEAANELIGALVMGLWNRLTRHQERSNPFRLIRIESPTTRDGLSALALMRRQELDGFIAGLLAQETTIDLPERASRGLDALGEMRGLMAAVFDMANDETKPASGQDIQATLRNMREMTKTAEHEMHAVILSCKRARGRLLGTLATSKPTLH
jgi:hypothetical protein